MAQSVKDLKRLRQEYSDSGLDREAMDPSPIVQFGLWFNQALDSGIAEPNAFSLGTVCADGQPAQRTVLMKSYDDYGFVFYTNHGSRKGRHLLQNNRVSMLFPWYELHRQVNIEGEASRIGDERSRAYFESRPRASQLGAWASRQSEIIASRSLLDQQFENMQKKFENRPVPLPPFWGGYRIKPHRFEFWQGRNHRLHDRMIYQWVQERWKIMRLSP